MGSPLIILLKEGHLAASSVVIYRGGMRRVTSLYCIYSGGRDSLVNDIHILGCNLLIQSGRGSNPGQDE